MGVREVGGRVNQVEREVGRISIIWRAIECDPFFDEFQPCGRGAQFYNLYRHFCGNK